MLPDKFKLELCMVIVFLCPITFSGFTLSTIFLNEWTINLTTLTILVTILIIKMGTDLNGNKTEWLKSRKNTSLLKFYKMLSKWYRS